MGIFIGVHEMGGEMSEDDAKATWSKYKESAGKHGAEARKTYFNGKEGKAFCVTEAESAQVVQDAHDEAGLAVKEIIEVQKIK